MKPFKSLLAAAIIALGQFTAPLGLGLTAVTISACKTTPLRTNFVSYGQLQKDVAAARVDWAEFVIAKKTAAGNIDDRNLKSQAILDILAKQGVVNAALQVWFDRNTLYKDAQKASAQTLPAPPDVLDAGNSYLSAVKENKL